MEPAKRFNNVIISQFVLAGAPTKVYVNNRSLTITGTDDVEDPTIGFGMDENGEMIQFDYQEVDHLLVAGTTIDIEKYNKAMEAKFAKNAEGGKEEDKPEGKDTAKEQPDAESMKDHYNIGEQKKMNLKDIIKEHMLGELPSSKLIKMKKTLAEISAEEVDAELDAAKSEIDAAKAKAKAAKAAEKDAVKSAKDKMKAAKANLKVATEDVHPAGSHPSTYTFGKGDIVNNKDSGCEHHGSKGIVIQIPQQGTVRYAVTNDGDTYRPGDVLTKQDDQLEKY